jgi:polyribonucleotide 5'-hydroxyl-kinase
VSFFFPQTTSSPWFHFFHPSNQNIPNIKLTLALATTTSSSFLPGDHLSDPSNPSTSSIYERTTPSPQMLHCIFAIMHASPRDTQEIIRDASVMGFVYVAGVDEKKRVLKILAPLNTRITDRPMVWGSWPEMGVSLI